MKIRILTIGSCAALLGACASAQKPAETTPAASVSTEPEPASTAPRTEEATGQVREAMLALRKVHFALDASTLLPEAREALAEAAAKLGQLPEVAIQVDGHTDSRGTSDYNMALGDRRAAAVIEYLTKLGIAADRLQAVSYGAEKPASEEQSQAGHAENRRVEFRLMRGEVQLVLGDSALYDDKGQLLGSVVR
jgi:peptidoglycan-associated lipoprotein